NPNDIVDQYGADTMRLHIMFIGDFEKAVSWSNEAVKGSKRFLDRCWNLQDNLLPDGGISAKNEGSVHRTIKKVTEDIDALKMNTAIAALMAMVNDFYANGCTRGEFRILLQLLSPFAPHMAEELWENAGFAKETGIMCMCSRWPDYDESKLAGSEKEIAVQVGGKLRATVVIPLDADNDTVLGIVYANEKIARLMEGMEVVKTIVVPNKLVNLILKPKK
ncbi:MAG: class I tRNA ligase family protein, partial [Oscillibacter sp.]|nr:class I tRNA ligase family protein [Oscillibacter sp.]